MAGGSPAKAKGAGLQNRRAGAERSQPGIDDPRLAAEDKLAVLLGTEGDGLCAHTIEGCDYCVRIPMAHGVDSLNVAAASAIAFWQLRRITENEVQP